MIRLVIALAIVGGGALSVPADVVTERVRVLVGDCRERLAEIEPGTVHTVVTSPPYWGLRDYGDPGQLGNEATPAEYVAHMVEVFREVRRALRDDGTVWLNLGDSYAGSRKGSTGKTSKLTNPARYEECAYPARSKIVGGLKAKDLAGIPWRVALAMQDDGWHLRAEIIWSKPNPLPESVLDRPTRSHEQLFLFSKRRRYYYDPSAMREPAVKGRSGNTTRRIPKDDGNEEAIPEGRPAAIGRAFPWEGTTRNRRSVWTVVPEQTKRAKGAPREKRPVVSFPPALIEPCILAGAPVDGVVLDPFAGRGTTLAVAIKHQRCAIGIEVNPDQAAKIAGRLRGTQVRIAECA